MRKLVFQVMAWEFSLENLKPYALEHLKNGFNGHTFSVRFFFLFLFFSLYDVEEISYMLHGLGR